MKRIISIMLAVMMLLGLSFSAAEEAPASTSFPRALLDWVQSLNLDTSDYAGSVRWVNSPLYEGTIRKNQGITELAVSGLGRAQIYDQKIMLEFGGKTYGVDLSKLTGLLRSFTAKKDEASKAWNTLKSWLKKALKDIVLPGVRISYSSGDFLLHIGADDETMKERTAPQSFEGIDFTYSQGKDGLSVSGRVKLYFRLLFAVDLSFDLKSNDEGLDLQASLDLSDRLNLFRLSSNKLAFHYAGDKIAGSLETMGMTFLLKGEKGVETNGIKHYTVSLTGQNRQNKVFELGSIVLTLDDQGAFSGSLKVLGFELSSITVRPIPKEPIEKISQSGTLMLGPALLRLLPGFSR